MIKKLLSFITFLMLATGASAQGWPANYGGVMLQGFYWDSYDDTQWTKFTEQADELTKYFDLIWVPNSGYCKQSQSMGYNPVYWYNHNSSFGKPKELLNMISTFKEKGTGFIMDVVINHRNGVSDWADFPSEKNSLDGQTYQMYPSDITKNDDGGYTASKGIEVGPNDDTGDDFSGARDLDHKSLNVQENCKAYCKFLIDKIGYVGFRLDMVKGYAPEYTKMYNEYSQPEFSVGEYWDGKDAIKWWINETGKTSAAFDFPLKYQLNKAFGSGDYSALSDKGLAGDASINRYIVTFVDNHDSDREDYNRCVQNQLGATAFILGMPGTPCVFLKHWKKWSKEIGNMILARKAAGITNQSQIVEQRQSGNGYVIKTQGSVGTVMVAVGEAAVEESNGFKLIASGNNFAYFVSNNVNVEGLNTDEPEPKDYKLYVTTYDAPNLYAWDNYGNLLNGEWPGETMTETENTPNGTQWYVKTFNATGLNIILNNGKHQTSNIEDLDEVTYLYYNGKTGYEIVDKDFFLPVKPVGINVYVTAPTAPHLYAWNDTGNLNGEWPGDVMTETETSDNGTVWYKATFEEDAFNLILNNGKEGDNNKTADIENVTNDIYLSYNGLNGYEKVTKDYEGFGVNDKVVVHVCADEAPNLYAWNADGELNGTWPGTKMTEVTMTANGTEWYTKTFYTSMANIIFNNGTAQTPNIENLTGEVYFAYNGSSRAEQVDATYVKGDIEDKFINIYVKADEAPYLYVWDEFGTPLNGSWPGLQMTETEEVSGTTFYTKKFAAESLNLIINDGSVEGVVGETQTDNIEDITSDAYFEFDGKGGYTDVTDDFAEFVLPPCARYQQGKLFIYFEASADYTNPYVWAWGEDGNISTTEWPGSLAMTRVGDNNGKDVYTYVFETEPTGLLFANVADGAATVQTSDFEFVNAGYYTVKGLKAIVPDVPTAISLTTRQLDDPSAVYDLQGRRISGTPAKGIYIFNNRKAVVR